ncbi:MAG: DsbA family protein [Pikeienuella sp.]
MRRLITAALFTAAAALPAPAAEFTPEQKAEIDQMIRAYILDNPEVLVEALQVLEERQQQQTETQDRDRIAANAETLLNDGFSHVRGAPDGDVTIVEFFDYRCPFCHKAHEAVKALMAADPKVRVVYKEFPILGPESAYASRAAMAALKQGADLYESFSDAMMENKGQLDEKTVLRLAGEAGLDMAALTADMDDPTIAANIRQTYALAREMDINGTPGFIIGDQIVRGFLTYEQLRDMIDAVREQG